MTLALALYQPEIAQNVGTILRLGACLGVTVHIIHPTGFPFSRASLKRGALDYLTKAEMIEHDSYSAFVAAMHDQHRRVVLLTTRAAASAYTAGYAENDVLLLGRESSGVPEAVAADAALRLRIPMRAGLRSINVALAAAMVLGEALRQTGHYETLA